MTRYAILTYLFVSVIYANTNLVEDNKWKRPWFCHESDCRPYVLVQKTDQYEKRCYPAALWMMAYRRGIPVGGSTDFTPLYLVIRDYIDGHNVEKMKLNLTVPVLLRIDFKHQYINLHSHVWVPPQTVAELPKPLNKSLHFVETERYCVYVYSFGGRFHSYDDHLKMEVQKFKNELDKAGMSYRSNFIWFAGYDAPWVKLNRHNEIWLRAHHNKPLIDVKPNNGF